jgi:hypothetical protein
MITLLGVCAVFFHKVMHMEMVTIESNSTLLSVVPDDANVASNLFSPLSSESVIMEFSLDFFYLFVVLGRQIGTTPSHISLPSAFFIVLSRK